MTNNNDSSVLVAAGSTPQSLQNRYLHIYTRLAARRLQRAVRAPLSWRHKHWLAAGTVCALVIVAGSVVPRGAARGITCCFQPLILHQPIQRFLAGFETGQVTLREAPHAFKKDVRNGIRSHPGGTLDVRPVKHGGQLDAIRRFVVNLCSREVR